MRPWLRAVSALTLLTCSVVPAVSGGRMPYDVVRDLRRLQDRIAVGDTVAEAAHAKAIERTANEFAHAPKEVWKDPRNARALIIYLFSGGGADSIRQAVAKADVPADLQPLYEGALAYGLGNDTQARTLLLPLDPRAMPNGLGGHLALVEATLSAQSDGAKAIALLDVARLLEPGTLVEEAALRKEMSLVGASGDVGKFALLTRRYLSVFPKSIYIDNFRQLGAATAIQLGSGDTAEAGDRLRQLMSGLDQEQQRRLYLSIARHAVVGGRITMATLASEEAGRLSRGSERDGARAMTYYGAAAIVGDNYDLGLKALKTVEPTRLDARDRDLQASALAVADMIRRPSISKAFGAGSDPQATTVADAERSIAAADALLKDDTK